MHLHPGRPHLVKRRSTEPGSTGPTLASSAEMRRSSARLSAFTAPASRRGSTSEDMSYSVKAVRQINPLSQAGLIASYEAQGLASEASAFARLVVSVVDPAGSCRARTLLWTCGRLGEFGTRFGLEATPEVLLSQAVIERFVSTGMSDLGESSRRTLAPTCALSHGAWCPGSLRPHRHRSPAARCRPPIGQARSPPCSASPSTSRAWRATMRLQGLLCLGLGAGLSGSDLRHVTGRHVRRHGTGVVVVVEGNRQRTVPVLAR